MTGIKKKLSVSKKRPIEQYEHKDKERLNNPPAGLVHEKDESDFPKKEYKYDPHIDPSLQWAGKAEHISFDVSTVNLHVHERIDPKTIISQVKRKNGTQKQMSLFQFSEENPPIHEALQFYKHKHNWTNRLVAGDSLLIMNSLIEKEGMAGKVQMIYIDPPYGIKYGSNFQPFVNKRDVKDGKDEDLTQEPEMIKAFRDTWELGIHSYLTYLRDRLLLARELLTESGSVFVQISDENVHHVREILDEVFGSNNFVSLVFFKTTGGFDTSTLSRTGDYLVWFSKDISKIKFHKLFETYKPDIGEVGYNWILFPDGNSRGLTAHEKRNPSLIPNNGRIYKATSIKSQGSTNSLQEFIHKGKSYFPGPAHHWKTSIIGLNNLAKNNRIHIAKNSIQYVRFNDDFPYKQITNVWTDTGTGSFGEEKRYVVETQPKVISKCILMTTDPGDLVLDPTCGSGTTAYVAEQWGRRWITCDTSRVAISLAKQRLMTSVFDYYELAHPGEGVGSGFKYKTVPHITLKSIANDEPPSKETLYDQPFIDKNKVRVTGPFTVEAVPFPTVKTLDDSDIELPSDESVSRMGETARQEDWKDELLKSGIRGKGGQRIEFSRIETFQSQWLSAEAETKDDRKRVIISFGPEHSAITKAQVEGALHEASRLVPKPEMLIFAGFQFDPVASEEIDKTDWPGITILKVQMNMDMQTSDLKKKQSGTDNFWLMGQPDAKVRKIDSGEDKGKYFVEVGGFDYYDIKTGEIISGGKKNIAMWMLDTDYDERSVFASQVFFPMAGKNEGWIRLAKSLKVEIDDELIESYKGVISLPFEPGERKQVAIKVIDDRGIESLKVMRLS